MLSNCLGSLTMMRSECCYLYTSTHNVTFRPAQRIKHLQTQNFYLFILSIFNNFSILSAFSRLKHLSKIRALMDEVDGSHCGFHLDARTQYKTATRITSQNGKVSTSGVSLFCFELQSPKNYKSFRTPKVIERSRFWSYL
jgi:hypothetical protein